MKDMRYDVYRLAKWNKAQIKLATAIDLPGTVNSRTGLLNVFEPYRGGYERNPLFKAQCQVRKKFLETFMKPT